MLPCICLSRVLALHFSYGWWDEATATTAAGRQCRSSVARFWHVRCISQWRHRIVTQWWNISYADGRHRTLRLRLHACRWSAAHSEHIVRIGRWRWEWHWAEYFSRRVGSQWHATHGRRIICLVATVLIFTVGNKTNAALLPPVKIPSAYTMWTAETNVPYLFGNG